jgi:hypothetical protein
MPAATRCAESEARRRRLDHCRNATSARKSDIAKMVFETGAISGNRLMIGGVDPEAPVDAPVYNGAAKLPFQQRA